MYLLQELNAVNDWPFWEATKKREARLTVGVDKIGQFSNRSSTSHPAWAMRFPNPLVVAGRPPNCMTKASTSLLSCGMVSSADFLLGFFWTTFIFHLEPQMKCAL